MTLDIGQTTRTPPQSRILLNLFLPEYDSTAPSYLRLVIWRNSIDSISVSWSTIANWLTTLIGRHSYWQYYQYYSSPATPQPLASPPSLPPPQYPERWPGAPVSRLLLSTGGRGAREYNSGLNLQLGIQTPPAPSIFQFWVCHSYIHYHITSHTLNMPTLSGAAVPVHISVFTKSLKSKSILMRLSPHGYIHYSYH